MTILGNICTGLALLLFLFFLVAFANEPRGHSGGIVMLVTLTVLPMWLLIGLALCAATAHGGFAWLLGGRGAQYLTVVAACLAMAAITWFTAALRDEPATQIPWAARPFMPWAHFLFPVLALVYSFLALNSIQGSKAMRVPVAAAGVAALLGGCGLLTQLLVSNQERQTARVNEIVAHENSRDQRVMADVEAMDPGSELGQLLNFTSEFESPAIRALALKKVLGRPKVQEDIATAIQAGWGENALRFFESNDLPDQMKLAGPVRDAILQEAAHIRKLMREEYSLRDDDFDFRARRALKVASKFRNYGVDFVPAIRAFRDALDEPRTQKIHPNCRRDLDQWLASAQ